MTCRIHFSLYVLLISLCHSVCNQRDGNNHDRRTNTRELTVATYNVEWAFTAGCANFGLFPADVWGAPGPHPNAGYFAAVDVNGNTPLTLHIDDIAQYILSLNGGRGADIVMLQELCDCAGLEAINARINHHYPGGNDFGYRPWLPLGQGPGATGQVIGMLTRIDPIANPLGPGPRNIENYAGAGNKGLRAIIPIWGQNFHIYGVHFTSMPNAHRQRDNDARVLEAHYHQFLPNVIVAGDFNGRKEERAQTDSNPFAITDTPAMTYNAWNGNTIRFWYAQAPITQNWPLVRLNDGAGTSQLVITNPDFTEAYGKRISQIVYHQGNAAPVHQRGQHTLNCVNYIQCFGMINGVCNAVGVVRIISITFRDAQIPAHLVKVAGNYVHPAINGPPNILANLCTPWNNGVNPHFRARSVRYLRTWTVANVNNQLEITNDDTPAARHQGDGVPKTRFFVIRIRYGGANYNVNNYAAATNRMQQLVNAAPGGGFELTLRRIDAYATRLTGLTDADTNGLGNRALNGQWTHWDCNGLAAGNPGNHRINTIDYIWYGTGFGAAINPNVAAASTQYIHTLNHHCWDLANNPPHHIYSDHDPIMVTFRQQQVLHVGVLGRRNSFGANVDYADNNRYLPIEFESDEELYEYNGFDDEDGRYQSIHFADDDGVFDAENFLSDMMILGMLMMMIIIGCIGCICSVICGLCGVAIGQRENKIFDTV